MGNPEKRAGVGSSECCDNQETIEQKYDTNSRVKVILIGEKDGAKSLESLLRMLKIIREVNNEKRRYSHKGDNEREMLVVELDVRDKKDTEGYSKTVPIRKEYETRDGLKLVLEENSDGTIKAHLKEDLETGGKSRLGRLVNTLTAITVVNSVKKNYILGANGEGEQKSVVELDIRDVRKFTRLEDQLLKEIRLYRNMQETLKNRMMEVERERTAFPKNVVDEIKHYTHFGMAEYKENIKIVKLTYFLRTLYGVVEAKTRITMEEILSNRKSPKIAKERRTMMYIICHRFPFLSSTEIGTIFCKDHATVLLAQGPFSGGVGIKPEEYKDSRYEAKTLYEDANIKHEHYKKINK